MRPIDADVFVINVVKSGFGVEFINKVTALLIDTPTIEPKQGEWIKHENPRYEYDREHGDIMAGVSYSCSLCGKVHLPTPFCPNCGAKMKGVDNK